MAIQILPPGPTKKTFAQKLNAGVGRGLEQAQEMMREHEIRKFQEQEKNNLSRFMQEEYGLNTEGLPQEFQKEILKGEYANKGKQLSALNKGPPGGLTGQPVPQEVSDAMGSIINENPEASADELKMKMDEAKVPPAYSNAYVENRRRQDERSENQDYQSFKDNSQYVEKVLNGYEGYKREKSVLDQMESIANKGNLPTPLLVQALGKIGLPIGMLENPDAEQFEKLTQELMKGIQGTYGSRILQSEVQMFMKSIPTLLNSPEGQKRLIQQWKILNEGKKIYYDAYKEVKSKNPKRLPPDLHEKVIEQSEGKLDKMAEKFAHLAEIPADYVKTPGKFLVRSPDGEMGEVNASELDEAIKAGYEYLE